MPSRRQEYQNRPPPRVPSPQSRSPPRENTRQSSSNRDYRLRDEDDDKHRQRGYDNSSHSGKQNPSHPQGGHNQVKLNIPETLRVRCGACKEGHDIRFCPHPNTEDGRTNICPICDTSNHPWYLCSHYDKKDASLQWDICWENRRGLPTIVHNNSLHMIFLKKLNPEDEETPFEDRLRLINTKAGPLSPAFVKRLMPPREIDDCVQQQLRNGRQLPWHLYKEILESPTKRHNQVIEDPATVDMQIGNFIPGTNTIDVPKAHHQKYFQSMGSEREGSQGQMDHSEELWSLQADGRSESGFLTEQSMSRDPVYPQI